MSHTPDFSTCSEKRPCRGCNKLGVGFFQVKNEYSKYGYNYICRDCCITCQECNTQICPREFRMCSECSLKIRNSGMVPITEDEEEE